MREVLLGHEVVGLPDSGGVGPVNTDRHSHEEVLGRLARVQVALLEGLDSKISKEVVAFGDDPRVYILRNFHTKLIRHDPLGKKVIGTILERLWAILLKVRDGHTHGEGLIVWVLRDHPDGNLGSKVVNLGRGDPVIHGRKDLLGHLVRLDVQGGKLWFAI